MQAIERSRAPVVFSHSNAKTLVDHDRNITDEQIKACAETGGVIGINGVNLFLGEERSSPAAVARHAAYIAELTGPEHVGLSLDYAPDDGDEDSEDILSLIAHNPEYWPAGAGYDGHLEILDVRQLPHVAEALANAGFNAEELAGILGGNFRRVAEQVWT